MTHAGGGMTMWRAKALALDIKITHSESRGTWFTAGDFRFMMQLACAHDFRSAKSSSRSLYPFTDGSFVILSASDMAAIVSLLG